MYGNTSSITRDTSTLYLQSTFQYLHYPVHITPHLSALGLVSFQFNGAPRRMFCVLAEVLADLTRAITPRYVLRSTVSSLAGYQLLPCLLYMASPTFQSACALLFQADCET